MTPPQESVLATPELLELILSQLPIRVLLVTASRISKTWHATTFTGPRSLPLRPGRLIYSILDEHFLKSRFFPSRAFLPSSSSSDSEHIQNPLLAAAFPPFFACSMPYRARTLMDQELPWGKASDAFKRAEASWRRMLLTQPPLIVMEITHTLLADKARDFALSGGATDGCTRRSR
ncbi:hypothetical protein C8R45DRAFT_1090511 [Mycena sanguinolenta]|nr:hypothetical protein C8R45DRAFT_1090511 [Mycena sanguinolenta]